MSDPQRKKMMNATREQQNPARMIDRAVHEFILPSLLVRSANSRPERRSATGASESVDRARSLEWDRAVAEHRSSGHDAGQDFTRGKDVATIAPTTLDMATPITDSEVHEFTLAVLADNRAAMRNLWARHRSAGHSVQALHLDLLSPSAAELGTRWLDDTSSFGDVTLAVNELQQFMHSVTADLVREIDEPTHGCTAFLGPLPGTDHRFGAAMVATFFEAYGWTVESGIGLSRQEILSTVRRSSFDVIGLSMGNREAAADYEKLISAVRGVSRNSDVVIMAGGAPFHADPMLAEEVGADTTAPDALRAVQWAARLVAQKKPT